MSAGVNVESIWPSRDEPAETPLSVQKMQVSVDRGTDVRPSLILDDGDQQVELSTTIGPPAEAVERLVKLAATALALAEELKP